MTASPQIDVRDLKSVRKAAAADNRVMLGDDYVAPTATTEKSVLKARRRRTLVKLNRSPLARRIVIFNLVSLIVLVAGVMIFSPSRDNLAYQRASALVTEAELAAKIFAAQAGLGAEPLDVSDTGRIVATLSHLGFRGGVHLSVYDPQGRLLAELKAPEGLRELGGISISEGGTFISDMLARLGVGIARVTGKTANQLPDDFDPAADVAAAIAGGTKVADHTDADGRLIFTIVAPIQSPSAALGAVVITSAAGELDRLVLSEREQLLTMFVIGALVSVAFSLLLASTIANPLSDLADAAELGRDRNARKMSPGRVRIPDLTARPDEIGRLSGALRGMVAALYERIEANEQFAADVAHEIKNPLASLRSAVGTMRMAKRDDQRERLLEVIEHDVRRLDRLVSDISNASRLDSELVKEEEQAFDLLKMLGNINDYLGKQASEKGIEYIADLPGGPIIVQGLEGRLAQVFVNLITNAISFCEDGDAIRVWVRKRENRVLIVVEDTGPGIPELALTKIFKRFYSERPAGQFGNNSGLGLAISKQIVESHGGVIWAENIRPTDADPASDPLGARFVVGLPV